MERRFFVASLFLLCLVLVLVTAWQFALYASLLNAGPMHIQPKNHAIPESIRSVSMKNPMYTSCRVLVQSNVCIYV
ncbi:hypothetical protein EI42_03186 [Thermosporothrix hazakensis]|uniref:Uncharacterized protein n=1 Tax=Thermosporothrix hazakensis TaxID=644383 RepID=A0A326U589_THEHA|nr:hypothetical protein EI42_03186 [Thermosporothrix hazakensis]